MAEDIVALESWLTQINLGSYLSAFVENGYERGPCKGIASLGIGYGQLNRIGSRVKIGGGWIFQGGSSSVSKIPEPAGHSSGGKILEINYQGCAACSR